MRLARRALASRPPMVLFRTFSVTMPLLTEAISAGKSMDLDVCVHASGEPYLGHYAEYHGKSGDRWPPNTTPALWWSRSSSASGPSAAWSTRTSTSCASTMAEARASRTSRPSGRRSAGCGASSPAIRTCPPAQAASGCRGTSRCIETAPCWPRYATCCRRGRSTPCVSTSTTASVMGYWTASSVQTSSRM